MSFNSETSGSKVLDWSLTIGGCICLAIGALVLVKSRQPLIPRSFMLLMSVSILTMGIGNLLQPRHSLPSSRFKFIAKVFLGFAIFSFSWALSHS